MRTVDQPEKPATLGAPIRPEKPAPEPVKVREGVYRTPDGRLFTDKPPPPP